MYELKVSVAKVLGECTADPPMRPGDHFTVRDGDIRIPEGGFICLYALQSLLPLITPKEREILERNDEDWMWRVHHAQCPDPKGRVIFEIERLGKLDKEAEEAGPAGDAEEGWGIESVKNPAANCGASSKEKAFGGQQPPNPRWPFLLPASWGASWLFPVKGGESAEGGLRNLRVMVEEVKGKCTSGMKPGDCFLLHSGRLYIPVSGHFCLYALHATLPLLPAKQRPLENGDWLKEDSHVICPDPAGNVVMRIERYP